MKVKIIAAVIVLLFILGTLYSIDRWYYGNQLADAKVRTNNLLEQMAELEEVSGGWERRARIAEQKAELTESMNKEMQDHLADEGRRVRALTRAVVALEDRLDIQTGAISMSDSTKIPWEFHDSAFDARLAVGFPGTIQPNPEPAVTGTLDISARVQPTVAISCDKEGGVFTDATVDDDRFSVTELNSVVDERVACIERPGFPRLIPRLDPATGVAVIAGGVVGYLLAN